MAFEIRSQWEKDIHLARQQSQTPARLKSFEHLGKELASRASFFAEMAGVIYSLGLSNPHEKAALSIEPTHPVRPQQLGDAFDGLGINPMLRRVYERTKLSLISLAIMERYAPDSDAKAMRESLFRNPLYLLDPLYGFVFLLLDGRVHNRCLAINIWSSHLTSMPDELARELWKNRSDNMLSGGAFAGRLLFTEMLPPEPDPLKRCMAPVLYANSEKELSDLVDGLRASASKHTSVELWFRGQRKDYPTPDRLELTRLGITPYSNIVESDFTPSLYRRYDEFLESTDTFEEMVLELAEWVHCAKQLIPTEPQKVASSPVDGVASLKADGITSYQRGLLLQQYGAPSAYLDITRDPAVAAWFATNTCGSNEEGKMVFQNYSWNGSNPEGWPTIFVFPLVRGVHPFVDLESILAGSEALRPARQKCGLLGGAGNLARNYCARYLGLKIRLGPNFKLSKPAPATDLFPPAEEDRALGFLKDYGLGDTKRHFALTELA